MTFWCGLWSQHLHRLEWSYNYGYPIYLSSARITGMYDTRLNVIFLKCPQFPNAVFSQSQRGSLNMEILGRWDGLVRKAQAAKPKDQSSIPRTHKMQKKVNSCQSSTGTVAHSQVYIKNKWMKFRRFLCKILSGMVHSHNPSVARGSKPGWLT